MKVQKVNLSEANVSKYIESAKSSGSDNGLTANYQTIILPIVQERKVPGFNNPFGVFLTLLFDNEGNYVKSGSVSINSVQRTLNRFDGDTIEDDLTVEAINALPTVELIDGSNRANGKSALETVTGWWNKKQIIAANGQEVKTVNFTNFVENRPVMDGARIRTRKLFEAVENESIFDQIADVCKELFDEKGRKIAEKQFADLGLTFPA